MKDYLKKDEWKIIEEGFNPSFNRISESIFSLGNGRFGQRANFEETYSGDTLQGHYLAGIYYPDKTRVGWWKNGYPEYFAKVLNAPNWTGIRFDIDGEVFDLSKCEVNDFKRILDMKNGVLERSCEAKLKSGRIVKIHSKRFCSIANDNIACIRYSFKAVNFADPIQITPYIDGDVMNEDTNYDEKFWEPISETADEHQAFIITETKKTAFQVCTGMQILIEKNGDQIDADNKSFTKDKYAEIAINTRIKDDQEIVVYKYVANITSENHPKNELQTICKKEVEAAAANGFNQLLADHQNAWAKKWEESDIIIEGDVAAQQGIRFNIFQLNQTYTGEDERLNIGPKGFTGEKYGGSTYWDTEAYCIPFYLSTADQRVARNLLVYRYKHLQKAIENATKLGFKDGAALYPMVTMNGEECHNEWEITFEEIHRNGAIAYAVFDYIRYTNDENYLTEYGLELLIGIARFWSQRVHFSNPKQKYVIHGVTGPNEYENNVNNNWYTNFVAVWCLKYTMYAINYVKSNAPAKFESISEKIKFYEVTETKVWKDIVEKMYFPVDTEKQIFLQQENFLDKEIIQVKDLPNEDRPIHQKWSWDRILRSCFIKQADVLQGIYFFEDAFDVETIQRNFRFYEPLTVHESSLSPCVHAILAAKIGDYDKAYEMYLRTARLDLDDYNNDTEDGCHITSMAGTWMAVVKGFGGMRIENDMLCFTPYLPSKWKGYSFKIRFRNRLLHIQVNQSGTSIRKVAGDELTIKVKDKDIRLVRDQSIQC